MKCSSFRSQPVTPTLAIVSHPFAIVKRLFTQSHSLLGLSQELRFWMMRLVIYVTGMLSLPVEYHIYHICKAKTIMNA